MASELELLKSNREELVEKIRYVQPFLDRLLQHGEIVQEEYDNIVVGKTPQDRARALLDVVGVKGRGAFHHFREHLKKVNPELEEVLHRCPKHNLRLKLYCEECETLLCGDCRSKDHDGHRCSSLVADADVIRREFTAFKRENRKLLIGRNKGPDDGVCGDTEIMRRQARDRVKVVKKTLCAKADEEYHWFLGQLGHGCVRFSPAISVSSIADSGSVSESETSEITEPDQMVSYRFPVDLTGHDKETCMTEYHPTLCDGLQNVDVDTSVAVYISKTSMMTIRVPPHPFKRLPTVEWLYSVGIWNFDKKFKPSDKNIPFKQLWYQKMEAVQAKEKSGISNRFRNRSRSEPAWRSFGTYM